MIYLNINNLSEEEAFDLCISEKHPLEYEENIEFYYIKQIVVSRKDILTKFDKKKILKRVFDYVTNNSNDDYDRINKWVRFLQDKFIHPYVSGPQFTKNSDGTINCVHDTIFLLVNNIARCGQAVKVLIDGLNLYYSKTRIVQLWHHVASEIYLNGKWCYIDCNYLRNGEIIYLRDKQKIASAEEIFQDNTLIAQLTPKLYYTDIDILLQDKNKFNHLWQENNYKNIKKKYNCGGDINNFIKFISSVYTRVEKTNYDVFSIKPTYYSYDIFSKW